MGLYDYRAPQWLLDEEDPDRWEETPAETEDYRVADEAGLTGFDWREHLPDFPGKVP